MYWSGVTRLGALSGWRGWAGSSQKSLGLRAPLCGLSLSLCFYLAGKRDFLKACGWCPRLKAEPSGSLKAWPRTGKSVLSSTFYWSWQVMPLAQMQGEGKQTLAMDGWWDMYVRRGRKLTATLFGHCHISKRAILAACGE